METSGGVRKLRHRGLELIGWIFTFTAAAYNLVRIRNLSTSVAGANAQGVVCLKATGKGKRRREKDSKVRKVLPCVATTTMWVYFSALTNNQNYSKEASIQTLVFPQPAKASEPSRRTGCPPDRGVIDHGDAASLAGTAPLLLGGA